MKLADIMNSLINKQKVIDNNLVHYKNLEFLHEDERGMTTTSVIHIYGDENKGKTLFALNLIKDNSDKSFIYVDTYFKTYVNIDNCHILRSNTPSDIIDFINLADSNIIDCIVIDCISNIKLSDNQEKNRSNNYYIALKDICSAAFKKRITLILLNTVNGNGEAYCDSLQVKSLYSTVVKFNELIANEDNSMFNIKANIEKARFIKYNKSDIININIRRI